MFGLSNEKRTFVRREHYLTPDVDRYAVPNVFVSGEPEKGIAERKREKEE